MRRVNVPLGVLFLGESKSDALAVDRALREGGYLPSVNHAGEDDLEIALGRDHVEVVIVDFDHDRSESLVRVIGTPARDLPCIAIGSSAAVDDAARAMRAGAHEYLLKKDLAYLPLAVEREVRERRERARRVQAERSVAASTEKLLVETSAQARSFRALHEVAKESGGQLEPPQLARVIVDGARKLIGVDAAALYWWDEARSRLERLAVGTEVRADDTATGLGIAQLAFREGRPVVLDGIRLAAVSPSIASLGFVSAFGVPLLSDDRVVGALIAGLRTDRPIDPGEIELLRLFASQVGPSIEANRLAAERDLQVRRLEALHRIAVLAGGVLDPSELGRIVADQARDLSDAWSAALLWLEPDGTLVTLGENHPVNLSAASRVVRTEGATGMALDSGDPVLIDDYMNWYAAADWAVKGGIASVLAVPLMVRDEALGCLVVRSKTSGHFQEDHVRVLSLLAAQVGPALEGARLAREREEQASTFRALHEIAVAAGGLLDPGELGKLAVENACDLLGVDGAVVFTWDSQAGLLQPLAETASSSSEPSISPGEGAIGLAFELCEPVLIEDYATFYKAMPESAARGMVSAAAVPLVVEERPVGALGVWTYKPRKFKASEVQLLTLFAAQLAPALEASRLAAQRDLQAHAFRALHELAVAAGGILDAVSLAELAIERACDLLGAASGVLVRFDAATSKLVALADNHPVLGSEPIDPRADGATGLAYRERSPVAIEDYESWEHAKPSARERAVKSVLAVPILVQDVVIGCLAVRWNQRRTISSQDAQLLGLLAAEVGPSIEAARVAEEREVRARTFAALHDLAVAVGGVLEPNALAGLAVQHARDLLDSDSSTLVWWEEDRQEFLVLAENHPALQALTGHTRETIGAVDVAFERREPVVVVDYQNSELAVEWARKLGIASVLIVPLLVDGRPVGCLGVRTNSVRNFSADDVQLLSLLAAQVAPAIHAAHLHVELRGSEGNFRAIFEEAPVLIARHDLEGRVQKMNRTGLEMFGYSADEIMNTTRELVLVDPPGDEERFEELRAGSLDRYRIDRRYRRRDGTIFWGATTLSLVRDGAGNPDFYYSITEDIDDRRRAADSLQQQADTFRALHALGVAASGILEPAALAATASLKARDLLAVDSAGVLWLDEEQQTLRVLADTRDDIPMGAAIPFVGPGADTLRRAEPLVIDDYPNWEGASVEAVRRGVKSAIIVPLHARDRLIGTLGVQSMTLRKFSLPEVELMTLISAAVGPAIEAARLHADLVDSEGRVRAIFRTAPMTIGRVDRNGVMVEMNPVLVDMTGYPLDEVIGRHFNDVPWAEDGFIGRRAQRDLLMGRRERVQYQKHLIRKDGSRFWAEITVSAVRRPDGEVDFFYVMVKDINERKVAEDALRASEILKSAIVNSALDCIVATDTEGRVIEFNPAAERVFGYRRKDVLGRDALDLMIAPAAREAHRANLRDVAMNRVEPRGEDRIESTGMRADGTEFPLEISVSMVRQEGRTIFSTSIRDLSEREQAITAKRENEAKSRFLASMSHELRTPLNSILGFAQLLDSYNTGVLNERQKRYLGHIESSGRHLLALITDVLDLSKVAAGQMEADLRDVEVIPLVEEAIARVGPMADLKPVTIHLERSAPIWVRADQRRFLQVLLNLLSNAIKFTPAGGQVEIAISRQGSMVEVAVIDTGIGISTERQEWIFEEFTQVHGGALESQDGTGLGLALTRRLLTLMDGTIRLDSEVGRGSTFTIALPRAIRRRERTVLKDDDLATTVPKQ